MEARLNTTYLGKEDLLRGDLGHERVVAEHHSLGLAGRARRVPA